MARILIKPYSIIQTGLNKFKCCNQCGLFFNGVMIKLCEKEIEGILSESGKYSVKDTDTQRDWFVCRHWIEKVKE